MNTIIIAIWINIILYMTQLCGSAWVLFHIIPSRFPLISAFHKSMFIFFQLLGHSFPVICIFGLVLKKNGGRILAIILNIIFVISLGIKLISNNVALNDIKFSLTIASQNYIFSITYLILFATIATILCNKRAKLFFNN